MAKIIGWIIGFSLGAAFGALLIALFVPISGDEIVKRIKEGYQETLQEARLAAQTRRAELEAELHQLQGREPDNKTLATHA